MRELMYMGKVTTREVIHGAQMKGETGTFAPISEADPRNRTRSERVNVIAIELSQVMWRDQSIAQKQSI